MFQYESVYKEKEKHIDLNKIKKKNFLACINENPLSPSLTHKNFKGQGGGGYRCQKHKTLNDR